MYLLKLLIKQSKKEKLSPMSCCIFNLCDIIHCCLHILNNTGHVIYKVRQLEAAIKLIVTVSLSG